MAWRLAMAARRWSWLRQPPVSPAAAALAQDTSSATRKPFAACQKRQGGHEHAEVGPLRRPHRPVDGDQQADRRAEELEISGELPVPGRPVAPSDTNRAVEQLAHRELARPVELLELPRI